MMRYALLLIAPLLLAAPPPTAAQGSGPQAVSRHDDWEVAYLTENGRKVCYAFTRAVRSEAAPAGRNAPVVTVTHRGTSRDQVALLAGFAFAANTEVPVEIGTAKFEFYTGGSSAFARDGKAVVGAFQRGREAVFRIPASSGRAAVIDRASLRGFTAAYQALNQCAGNTPSSGTPARRR